MQFSKIFRQLTFKIAKKLILTVGLQLSNYITSKYICKRITRHILFALNLNVSTLHFEWNMPSTGHYQMLRASAINEQNDLDTRCPSPQSPVFTEWSHREKLDTHSKAFWSWQLWLLICSEELTDRDVLLIPPSWSWHTQQCNPSKIPSNAPASSLSEAASSAVNHQIRPTASH